MSWRAAALTDVGRKRSANEDSCAIDEARALFVVSDGMGGHSAGDRASALVVSELPELLGAQIGEDSDDEHVEQALATSVLDLNARTREAARSSPDLKGMGATLVLAWLRGERLHVSSVGDSRAYLLRDGEYRQVTTDHSLVAMLVEQGHLTKEEAKKHPAASSLLRYVGMDNAKGPDVHHLVPEAGDRLLLCSDGLWGMVEDDEVARLLTTSDDPQALVDTLVAAANEAGGEDNVTALVVIFD